MDGRPEIRIHERKPRTGSRVACAYTRACAFPAPESRLGGMDRMRRLREPHGAYHAALRRHIPPLWPRISFRSIPAMMRLGYMARVALPFFGPRMLMKNPGFVHRLLTRGENREGGWSEFELNAFSDQFREKARAQASAKLFRSFLLVESVAAALLRKYGRTRITTPTRLLFG